eukprot:TRINITY_DN1703_c0_g1_i2.p1 TRINITY_DN1703_c0_g1~~TRINITY_DN1703_c0_g1_i2.p1  ORF type:complete len:315 (-),score=87.11 TRINITY_DN1703_c0_g1_i2:59-1003(-)
MKILDRFSIGLNLSLGRYECTGKANVISLTVPTPLLIKFIEVQKLQDDIERNDKKKSEEKSDKDDKGDRDEDDKGDKDDKEGVIVNKETSLELKKKQSEIKKEIIKCEGMDDDQFRHFALSLFQIRAEEDPPLVLVHSQYDHGLVMLWFRDFTSLKESFHFKILPNVKHVYWPNYSHLASTNPPVYFCEKSDCNKWGGFVKENKDGILDTFVEHAGQLEKDMNTEVKRKMIEIWQKDYASLLDKYVEENKGTPEEAVTFYENLLKEREPKLKEEVYNQTISKMSRCSRCKKVRYCSVGCQKSDWERHKHICFSK